MVSVFSSNLQQIESCRVLACFYVQDYRMLGFSFQYFVSLQVVHWLANLVFWYLRAWACWLVAKPCGSLGVTQFLRHVFCSTPLLQLANLH